MNIFFRTDSSLQIGSGHVMRCLTLADELRQRGADVTFICREHHGNLIAMIEGRGYEVVSLPLPVVSLKSENERLIHAEWLGATWEQDAVETIAALSGARAQWMIVDHYAIDRRWEEQLRLYCDKIMVIDDIADRSHDCELLLDQNFYLTMESRYENLVPAACCRLLGPKYSLLRPQFASARRNLRQRDGHVGRVLVCFGGADSSNEMEKSLRALAAFSERKFEVDVVVSAVSASLERIQSICADNAGFHCHCQVDNMAELMVAADIAIGAGGSITWERCAMGLPALIVTVAANQLELASCAAEGGLVYYLGDKDAVTSKKIEDTLAMLMALPELLRCFSANGLALVDARGAQRVAGILLPPAITVRKAGQSDCDSIYEWRNAEETRRHIFDKTVIPIENHRIWFQNTLTNPDRILLIGENAGRPVGVLRYDLTDDKALVSVYLVPGGQGQGVGTELIRCGSRWLKENRPEIKVINAEIMNSNVASLRAFEQAGYQEHHVTYQEVLQ